MNITYILILSSHDTFLSTYVSLTPIPPKHEPPPPFDRSSTALGYKNARLNQISAHSSEETPPLQSGTQMCGC